MNQLLDNAIGMRITGAYLSTTDDVVLTFGTDYGIKLSVMPDTDEITVSRATANPLVDDSRLTHIVGTSLYNWWVLTNNAGLQDGILLAFGSNQGVLFTVMASTINILRVEGDQLA